MLAPWLWRVQVPHSPPTSRLATVIIGSNPIERMSQSSRLAQREQSVSSLCSLTHGPIVEWISQKSTKLQFQVRILVGPPSLTLPY